MVTCIQVDVTKDDSGASIAEVRGFGRHLCTCGYPVRMKAQDAGKNPRFCAAGMCASNDFVRKWCHPNDLQIFSATTRRGRRVRRVLKQCSRPCEWCLVLPVSSAGSRGPRKRFCSPGCNMRAATRHGNLDTHGDQNCSWCFLWFSNDLVKTKYCSAGCRARSTTHARQLNCIICGDPFISTTSQKGARPTLSCSRPECRREFALRRSPRVVCECRGCGTPFEKHAISTSREWCSRTCYERVRRKSRHLYSNTWQRMRCEKMRRNGHEKIDVLAVFERDNWTCQICDIRVNREAVHPDSMAPTIDHIVPVSKGGAHTWDNVRCAHSICNTRKNAKIPEPLVA